MKLITNLSVGIVIIGLSIGIHAETIDFDDLILDEWGPNPFTSFSEDGFIITSVNSNLGAFPDAWMGGMVSSNGTNTSFCAYGDYEVGFKLETEDNSLFRINSIDLAEVFKPDHPAWLYSVDEVAFEGLKDDGSIINASFTLDKINDGPGGEDDFETFVFSSDWYSLVYATVIGINLDASGVYMSFDNIVVNEVTNQNPVAGAGDDQTAHPGDIITLSGSGSTDPDNNYPLTFAWTIIDKPEGSIVELSNPSDAITTLEIDLIGDYVIQLIVTDALGAESDPDMVRVSTFNSPPVADAGEGQVAHTVGLSIQLDGSESDDADNDPITFAWEIIQKPDGSTSVLDNPGSSIPRFTPDEYGDYVIQLIVSDSWESSEPDNVLITFENLKPVAVAGDNQSVVVNETVYLNGNNSYDENNNMLSFNWEIVSKPEGSEAVLYDADMTEPTLIPDIAGEYVINLIVNDGTVDSDPGTISIVAISYSDALTQTLQDAIVTINNLPEEVFRRKKAKKTLTHLLNGNLLLIDKELYKPAYMQLKKGFSRKIDGCAITGSADENDWITDCEAQEQVYPLIQEAAGFLSNLFYSDEKCVKKEKKGKKGKKG